MKERGVRGFYIGAGPLAVASFFKSFFRMVTYDLSVRSGDHVKKRKFFF